MEELSSLRELPVAKLRSLIVDIVSRVPDAEQTAMKFIEEKQVNLLKQQRKIARRSLSTNDLRITVQ